MLVRKSVIHTVSESFLSWVNAGKNVTQTDAVVWSFRQITRQQAGVYLDTQRWGFGLPATQYR